MNPVKFCVFVITTIVLFVLFGWVGYRHTPESSPVARGAAYAEIKNCVECHANPLSPPPNNNNRSCPNINMIPGHPEYNFECTDLMAYFESVRLIRNFEDRIKNNIGNPVITGEQLARKYYCFQCHGQLGQGGFKNSRSLKGYIPGYFGRDFETLTRNADPDSVREWITQGVDPIIFENPVTGRIAEFFFRRQTINMPRYQSLDPEEIEILVNYVITLHKFGPMTAETVRLYGER